MSFNGNGTRLVGDDGFLQTATFGSETIGDAATALPAGIYMIIAVAGSSAFPAPADGGDAAAVGDVLYVTSADSITPAIGDDVVELVTTDRCDISSWSMGFTKEQIDTTTLCDAIKVFRGGKTDMEGQMNGVFILGTSDDKDGFVREFIDIVKQDGDTSFDKFTQQENIGIGLWYLNDDTNLADRTFVVGAYQLYGESFGGEMGSPQSFDASFKFATKTYTSAAAVEVSLTPTFHRIGS
jgi:hypothetical protein